MFRTDLQPHRPYINVRGSTKIRSKAFRILRTAMGPLQVFACCYVVLVASTLSAPVAATPLALEQTGIKSMFDRMIDDRMSEHLVNVEQKLDEILLVTKTYRECAVDEEDTTTTTTTTPATDASPPQERRPTAVELTVAPKSCAEALAAAASPASGIQHLYLPNSGLKQFPVYCMLDPDNGAAWTVIQRRVSAKTDFFLDWHDYKYGFGDLHMNFFIGLDKLYALTTQAQPQELWVSLRDPLNVNASARYNAFAIDDETNKYRLNVLGDYEGDAGDSLRYSVGQKFSTKDSDSSEICAKDRKSGWWFDYCTKSNLNGLYNTEEEKAGITWFGFRDHNISMKYVHMAIRPRQ